METQAIYTVDVTMDGVQRMDTIPQPMPASLEVLCGRVALLCRQIQQLTNSIHVDYPRFQVRAPQFRELFDGMDGVKEKHMEGEYNLHRSIEIGAPYIGARGVTFTTIDKESWEQAVLRRVKELPNLTCEELDRLATIVETVLGQRREG